MNPAMKKTVISFITFFLFQSFLLANDESSSKEYISNEMELLKKQVKISEADLEKAKKEFTRLDDEMANFDIGTMPMSDFNITKDGMLKSIESLKAQGIISQTDFDKAKKELSGLSDHQLKTITNSAIEIVKKDPKKALGLIDNMKVESISPKLK